MGVVIYKFEKTLLTQEPVCAYCMCVHITVLIFYLFEKIYRSNWRFPPYFYVNGFLCTNILKRMLAFTLHTSLSTGLQRNSGGATRHLASLFSYWHCTPTPFWRRSHPNTKHSERAVASPHVQIQSFPSDAGLGTKCATSICWCVRIATQRWWKQDFYKTSVKISCL